MGYIKVLDVTSLEKKVQLVLIDQTETGIDANSSPNWLQTTTLEIS